MTLMKREVHPCDVESPPPDPLQSWDLTCDECGSRWRWTRSFASCETRIERYGFLWLRKRVVVEEDVHGGFWMATVRMSRLVDMDGVAGPWDV